MGLTDWLMKKQIKKAKKMMDMMEDEFGDKT